MKVLVCGARSFDKPAYVRRRLAALHDERPVSLVITGGARGVDAMARGWAQCQKIPCCEFPPNWNYEGKKAGPTRNAHMLTFGQPDLVVAFPGGRGTADMVRRAQAAGIEVMEITVP